jgi:hypothetical protein
MRKVLLLVVIVAFASLAYGQQKGRPQDNVNWLKHKLNFVCLKQMQIIADAMMRYHQKNNSFPSKPSDLKGYITSSPYDNGRIAYLIFISPADTTKFDYKADGWDFADKHGSYILNGKADINNWKDILISEKKDFLWLGKKNYVFVGGHGFTTSEESLKKFQKTGKL